MVMRRVDSRGHRPDRHEARPGPGGWVSGLHLGRAYAVNARGAFNAAARPLPVPGGFLRQDIGGHAPMPDPSEREATTGPASSDLVAFLETVDPTPSSLAAAAAIRAMAGPLAASHRIDALLPSWGFEDVRTMERVGPSERGRIVREAAVLGRVMPRGRGRTAGIEFLRHAVPASPMHPVGEDRLRRILEGERSYADLAELRAALSLPEQWVPEGGPDLDAFRAFAQGYGRLAALLGGYAFLSFARGRHAEAMAALHPDGMPTDADRDCLDLVDAFEGQVVGPELEAMGLLPAGPRHRSHDAPSRHVAAAILFGRKGLPAILAASRRWHGSPLSQLPDAPNVAWAAPGPDLVGPEGHALVWLTSAAQLVAEGGRLVDGGLQHCVAGYAGRCAAGTSAILSIRHPVTGRRLSTVEVAFEADGSPAMVQHRGARNLSPPDDAARAAAWLEGALPGAARTPGTASIPRASDDAVGESVSAWSSYLPRPARTREGFRDAALAEADALVRRRWARGWLDLEGGRILPTSGTPSGPSRRAWRMAEFHPAAMASEIRAAWRAGRRGGRGGFGLAGGVAAAVPLFGFGGYTVLFHLFVTLDAAAAAAAVNGFTTLPAAALPAAALLAAALALVMPATALAGTRGLLRWHGARTMRREAAAAARRQDLPAKDP